MKIFLLLFCLFSLNAFSQKIPAVNFNHLYIVIDSADLHALQKSDFVKNKFAGLIIRTTKADSGAVWTGTYMQGLDNYLEIFDSSSVGEPTGNAGIGLSVDRIGEIKQLESILSKKYLLDTGTREMNIDDKTIPWFSTLTIQDSIFYSASRISFWVMEYKPEFYDYKHWDYKGGELKRTVYLSSYAKERENKIVKRFTGITLNTTDKEREVISGFLLNCGYKQANKNSFISPENFKITFLQPGKKLSYSIASIEFEATTPEHNAVKISSHVEIQYQNKKGRIIFN
jgi:hypothetical protein